MHAYQRKTILMHLSIGVLSRKKNFMRLQYDGAAVKSNNENRELGCWQENLSKTVVHFRSLEHSSQGIPGTRAWFSSVIEWVQEMILRQENKSRLEIMSLSKMKANVGGWQATKHCSKNNRSEDAFKDNMLLNEQ